MAVITRYSATQDSTNSYEIVDDFTIQTTFGRALSITIKNAGSGDVNWIVYGGNLSDLSDKTIVNPIAVVFVDASDAYSISLAPFEFYCVYIQSDGADNPGTATLSAIVRD